MAIIRGLVGPFEPKFHKNVGVYLDSSPDPQDRQCLIEFFRMLRSRACEGEYYICADFMLVYTCNHIITFTIDGRRVLEIKRGVIQSW